MLTYQIGIIVLGAGALLGVYFISTRWLRAIIMAATSGGLVLLCGLFYRLIAQQEILWDLVILPENPIITRPSITLIEYIQSVGEKMSGYSLGMEFTFWVLLVFVLLAPFVGTFRRVVVKE